MWLSSSADAANSGLSRYTHNLVDEMSQIGSDHHFTVFAPSLYEFPETWLRRDNLTLKHVDVPSLPKRVMWEHFGCKNEFGENRLDVWFSAAQGIPVRSPIPTAVMIHDLIPLIYPEHHLRKTVLYYRWCLKYSSQKADRVFANSACTKADIERFFLNGEPSSRVSVTLLGPGNIANGSMATSLKKPYLFTLGSLEWRKNLHGLLVAFALLRQKQPDLRLVIGGSKRFTSGDHLSRRIVELEIADAIEFLGYVPDDALPAIFQNAACFVFPSLYEGFGLPVLEALLYGSIVACSDKSSIPEVAGKNAFYFDPGSTSSMVEAIEKAVNTDDRQLRIEQGQEWARQFTWKRTAEQTLSQLEKFV